MSDEAIIRAGAMIIVGAALDVIQADPHQWSMRPCPTCRTVGSILGRPFGCYRYQQQKSDVSNVETSHD